MALLTGCASVLNSGARPLQIDSNPNGAAVYENGAQIGTTPYAYTYGNPAGEEVSMELRMEGRQPVAFTLHPKRKSSILFADAMLLGIPYAVDAKSKALYGFPQGALAVNLYRTMPVDRQKLDLPLAVLENGTGAGAKLGKWDSHVLTVDSRELADLRYPATATSALARGFDNTSVAAHVVRIGTAQGDADVQRAKVLLKPLLKSLVFDIQEQHHRAYGQVRTEMDWRFFNGIAPDSLLFAITKTTTLPVFDVSTREVFALALQDAARQLMDEEGLYERIGGAYSNGLLRSKGAVLKLEVPAPLVFIDSRNRIPTLVKGVVTVQMKDGHGSGFLITNDGYILTNAHVVGQSATAKVRFEQGFSMEAQVVKVNRDFDVALLKVAGNDLPALSIGDDGTVQLGEELFAIGTPLDEKLGQSVSRGIMSGKREIDGRKFLQTDVSINPGNSGGPLINGNGKVVGITTMKVKAAGVEGIGFGVPISTALEMLNIEFTK